MSVNFNDIIKQGYVRLKGQKVGVWKKHWVILRKSSSKGPQRLEKYQDEKASIIGHEHKDIVLASISSVLRVPSDVKKHALAIHFLDGTERQFACDSDMEADNWVTAVKDGCLMSNNNTFLANPDILSNLPSEQVTSDMYNVYLLPCPNLDIYGECLLVITSEHIVLLDIEDPAKRLASWPLNALRRYGRDDTKFTFEAGRHCDTGEGLFVFNTKQGEKIYKSVHSATETIVATYRVQSRRQQDQPERPPPPFMKSQSMTDVPPDPVDVSPTTQLRTSKSFPHTRQERPPVPPPVRHQRSIPLPPVPGTGPATNYDILARSYSGKAPQPPAPRKKSADSTTPVKIGFRHPSDSSEGSFSDVPWTGTPDGSQLDSLPSEAPPPPPPRSTPSSSVGSATATIAAAAATATVRDADEDDLEVIYEEKGLGKAFRQFLATRKEDV